MSDTTRSISSQEVASNKYSNEKDKNFKQMTNEVN
jgi:hypothetical protein